MTIYSSAEYGNYCSRVGFKYNEKPYYKCFGGEKLVLKTRPYCLHSKEPEWDAFPVGSLSGKGKDSINNVTELPFNISEKVTEQKGTLKEVSRGH